MQENISSIYWYSLTLSNLTGIEHINECQLTGQFSTSKTLENIAILKHWKIVPILIHDLSTLFNIDWQLLVKMGIIWKLYLLPIYGFYVQPIITLLYVNHMGYSCHL